MTNHCPIPKCPFTVPNPLRMCKEHYRLVPKPQKDALSFYAKRNKGGVAHQEVFARAVETVMKFIAGTDPKRDQVREIPKEQPASMPYRDD